MTNTVFEDIEKGYEAKYKMDEELRFKAHAKRDKLLGLWAAGKMGIEGEAAEKYAKEVVVADLEEPGPEDVIRKVMGDFEAKGVSVTEAEVREELARLMGVALKELGAEYPEPLDKDHEGAN